MPLDQEFARRTARSELAIEDREARSRIADCTRHENVVARAREVAPRHAARGLAEQRDCDCEPIAARDVAADHFGRVTSRDPLDSGVQPIEEARVESFAHCEIDYACGRPAAHCGDIAQIYRERFRAELFRRSPREPNVRPPASNRW